MSAPVFLFLVKKLNRRWITPSITGRSVPPDIRWRWCKHPRHRCKLHFPSRACKAEPRPRRSGPDPSWRSGSAWWSARWAARTGSPALCRCASGGGRSPWNSRCGCWHWRSRCPARSSRICPWTCWSARGRWRRPCRTPAPGSTPRCGGTCAVPQRRKSEGSCMGLQGPPPGLCCL